jgi:hypothetical protein
MDYWQALRSFTGMGSVSAQERIQIEGGIAAAARKSNRRIGALGSGGSGTAQRTARYEIYTSEPRGIAEQSAR